MCKIETFKLYGLMYWTNAINDTNPESLKRTNVYFYCYINHKESLSKEWVWKSKFCFIGDILEETISRGKMVV